MAVASLGSFERVSNDQNAHRLASAEFFTESGFDVVAHVSCPGRTNKPTRRGEQCTRRERPRGRGNAEAWQSVCGDAASPGFHWFQDAEEKASALAVKKGWRVERRAAAGPCVLEKFMVRFARDRLLVAAGPTCIFRRINPGRSLSSWKQAEDEKSPRCRCGNNTRAPHGQPRCPQFRKHPSRGRCTSCRPGRETESCRANTSRPAGLGLGLSSPEFQSFNPDPIRASTHAR